MLPLLLLGSRSGSAVGTSAAMSPDRGPEPATSSLGTIAAEVEGSKVFKNFILAVIVVNTAVLAVEADYPYWEVWSMIDTIFLTIYFWELSLRLYVHGCGFFLGEDWLSNGADFFIVCSWMMEFLYVLLAGGDEETTTSVILEMRLMRLPRVLRVFRVVRCCPSLARLLQGLVESVVSVVWIALAFLILVALSAIFVTTVVGSQASAFGVDSADIDFFFGSLWRSTRTLFVYLTLDDWSYSARIVNERYAFMEVFWAWYIVAGAFMILSLLTGLMAQKMNEARKDIDAKAARREVKIARFLAACEAHFEDEALDWDGFQEFCGEPQVVKLARLCGIRLLNQQSQKEWFFYTLDRDLDGQVTFNEFKDAVMLITNYQDRAEVLREVMWMEGDLLKMRKILNARDWYEEPQTPRDVFEHELSAVHDRASLLRRRLGVLEHELHKFFKSRGFHPPPT